jgi:MFS family permease
MNNTTKSTNNYRIPLFCGVTMLFWFSMYTYVPILSLYVTELGASSTMAGIIVGSYGFVQMLLRIPLGIASDKFHKRRLFINFGLTFTLISGLGLWAFKEVSLILVFRGLAGAAAATWVDFTVLYTSYYKHEEATKAIGTINFYNSIAQMLAMLLGGLIAEKLGYGATFIVGALVGLAGFIASFFIVEKFEDNAQKITLNGVIEVVRDNTLMKVSVLAIIAQLLTFSTVFGFTPKFASDYLSANKFQMGLLTVFSSLPTAFASLLGGGKLSRKYGEWSIVTLGFALVGIFTVLIPFIDNIYLLMFTQIFAGLGRGFSFSILMGLSVKHFPSEKRATAMGFFQSIYGLGMFIGPVFIGIIEDIFSINKGFIALGIISCITAFVSARLINKKVSKGEKGIK